MVGPIFTPLETQKNKNRVRKLFEKVSGRIMSCLPVSALGWPKKCKTSKFYKITYLYIVIKTSNQKYQSKTSLILAMDIESKSIEIKAKQIST